MKTWLAVRSSVASPPQGSCWREMVAGPKSGKIGGGGGEVGGVGDGGGGVGGGGDGGGGVGGGEGGLNKLQ